MLINARPEELVKYSKGEYDKEKFIEKASGLWDWTDKQIRMIYITADLAIKGQGVFSVSNEKFREMFEKRFNMTISRSTVIRFFHLLEELGLLTVNTARRRNRKQSANILIVEPIINNETPYETPDETPNETLIDTPTETLDETHNIAFNNAFNKDLNKVSNIPLTKNNTDFVDRRLFKKYPDAPFTEIRQQILSSSNLTINNINQYKGMLEYRLRIWKPNHVRTELTPEWFNSREKANEQPIVNKDDVEAERIKLLAELGR